MPDFGGISGVGNDVSAAPRRPPTRRRWTIASVCASGPEKIRKRNGGLKGKIGTEVIGESFRQFAMPS